MSQPRGCGGSAPPSLIRTVLYPSYTKVHTMQRRHMLMRVSHSKRVNPGVKPRSAHLGGVAGAA
jgi:hypothetical protein